MNLSETSGFFSFNNPNHENFSPVITELKSSEGSPFILYKCSRQGRITILKAIKEEFRDKPMYEDILRKEYEIGKSLNHPNIREYYNFLSLPKTGPCIEMEWIDGKTLDELMPECQKDKAFCDKIARQILDAVRFMHMKQVVHRDLKPSNIMVTTKGNIVKLIDFSLSDSDSHIILKGNAGTAMYASPEQVNCEESDSRSDIWSLGIILSEMSSRKRYQKVAAKCTKRKISKRFADADAVEQALLGHQRNHAIIAIASLIVIAGLVFAIGKISMKKKNANAEVIDEIFMQATEMVENSCQE
jgi:serine/threonine protein kinase